MFDFITLAAKDYGNIGENFSEYGGNVTLSGVLIVFAMLVLLVFIISIFGFVMSRLAGGANKPKKVKEPKIEKKTEVPKVPVVTATANAEEEDVIAAISAAVMMMYEGTGKTPVIRSIRPAVKGVRSAWATAGVVNNTRPF